MTPGEQPSPPTLPRHGGGAGERPLIGVLALQGDVREHLRALRRCGADAVPVRRPSELADVAGLVVPGGESTTMSRLARVFDLLEPVRDRIAAGMPAYGSCAGMIMLARTVLDGRPDQEGFDGIDMVVRRNAFGRQVDSFETDLAFTGITDAAPDRPGPHSGHSGAPGHWESTGPRESRSESLVHAVFIRAPWVERVGPGVEVLARVIGGPGDGRIVAVRQGNLLATSFHPELTGDLRVHDLFVRLVRSTLQGRGGVEDGPPAIPA